MVRHGGERPLEAGRRVVAEQEVHAGIELPAGLGVELLELVEPRRGARAGADANLEADEILGALALGLERLHAGEEVARRRRHRVRVIGVGRAGRQRRLEPLARGRFPVGEMPPEQPVEVPDQAVAIRLEHVEIDVALGIGVGRVGEALDRLRQVLGQPIGHGLPQVHRDLGQRQKLAPAVGGAPHHHGVAEVGLVLNPVEMHAQRRRELRVEHAFLDHRHHRPGDEPGQFTLRRALPGGFLLTGGYVVDVNDHRQAVSQKKGLGPLQDPARARLRCASVASRRGLRRPALLHVS